MMTKRVIQANRTIPRGLCEWLLNNHQYCGKESNVKFMWKEQNSNIFTVTYICSKHKRQFRNALNHIGYEVQEEPVFKPEKVTFT